MKLSTCELESPLGRIALVVGGAGVCALDFDCRWSVLQQMLRRRFGEIELVPETDPDGLRSRLERYFQGELEAIRDIPVDPGGTPFQLRVWAGLQQIPAGTTMSYGALARMLELPVGASRAVGLANGSNPIAIIIPCHRVIGADGRLVGYGGGLDRKRWLLEHEGIVLEPEPVSSGQQLRLWT